MMIVNKQFILNNLIWGENSRGQNRQEKGLLPAVFVSPDNSRIWGTDHSPWDGNVNMNAVKATGASFTIIKCMDGTVPSRFWLENRNRAIAAGLIVGDYCWLYPNNRVSAGAQAQAVWNLIKNEPKQLPLTVDFEWTRYMGQSANPIYADLELFVTEFTRLSGYEPMVYSAAGYMNPMGRMPDSLRAKISYFWFANYGVLSPTLPFGFLRWDFWQFACTGDATVISPNDSGKLETDLNYWYSNLDSLRRVAGLGSVVIPPIPPLPPIEPIPPEPEPGLWNAYVAVNDLNVRKYPVVIDGSLTGQQVNSRETFSGRLWVGNGYVWMKIDTAARPEIVGKWVAVRTVDGIRRFITLTKTAASELPTEPPAGIPLPAGTIHQILHDHEANDGKQRYGMPEVYPLHLSQYCELTEEWQWWWFRQLIHSYTGFVHWDEKRLSKAELDMLKGKWRSLTKDSEAFTNFKGTRTCTDYISGVIRDENPGQEPLACCGDIVKILGGPVRLGGKILMTIETLDGNRPPPPIEKINRLTAPHIIQCATNVSRIIFPDGKRRVDPFPQLAPHDTLFALRTSGKEAETYTRDGVNYAANYILASRLRNLPAGTKVVPRPYYP